MLFCKSAFSCDCIVRRWLARLSKLPIFCSTKLPCRGLLKSAIILSRASIIVITLAFSDLYASSTSRFSKPNILGTPCERLSFLRFFRREFLVESSGGVLPFFTASKALLISRNLSGAAASL